MGAKFTDLQCKEVICVNDGRRLGFITDVQISVPEGEVLAVVVPGPCRFLGVWGRHDDFVIPWRCVRRIGPDIVLVDIKPEECRVPRGKQARLFG
jgi:YlmC/YmxH family sporulation protein